MFKFKQLIWFIFLLLVTMSSEASAETLRVGIPTKFSEPFVIKREDTVEGTIVEGMIIDIWTEIAKEKNLEYEWVYYDNYNDAIDAVSQQDIDIFVGPISITPERLEKVEFTLPVDEFEIVVVGNSDSINLWSKIQPFIGIASLSSMGVLVLSLFIVGNLIWLAERKKNPENFPEHYGHGISNGMWFAMVTLTTVGYGDYAPVTRIGRLIATLWMLITLFALSSITAGLATAFTVSLSSQSNPAFTSVDDIRKAKIVVVSGWASARWASHYGATIVEVPTIEEAIQLVSENKVDGFISNRSTVEYYLKESPEEINVSISNFTIANDLYGFALPPESKLTTELDVVIMKMRNNAKIKIIEDQWF